MAIKRGHQGKGSLQRNNKDTTKLRENHESWGFDKNETKHLIGIGNNIED